MTQDVTKIRTHYFEAAGQRMQSTERVDGTLEKRSAHIFPVEPGNLWALTFNCLFLLLRNTRINVSYLRFWHNFGVVMLNIPEKDIHRNVIVGNPRKCSFSPKFIHQCD